MVEWALRSSGLVKVRQGPAWPLTAGGRLAAMPCYAILPSMPVCKIDTQGTLANASCNSIEIQFFYFSLA